jgi:hypothetical protein
VCRGSMLAAIADLQPFFDKCANKRLCNAQVCASAPFPHVLINATMWDIERT